MRISDWSSDVCSSDLLPAPVADGREGGRPGDAGPGGRRGGRDRAGDRAAPALGDELVRRAGGSAAGARAHAVMRGSTRSSPSVGATYPPDFGTSEIVREWCRGRVVK